MRAANWFAGCSLAIALSLPFTAAQATPLTNVSATLDNSTATVSIIIDDVGHNRRFGEQVAYLPAPLTLAILPHTPFDQHFADLGQQLGKEVMLHMPMQAIGNRAPSQHQLEVSMTQPAFMSKLRDNLNAFSGYTGINNHQGSLLMSDTDRLTWMMSEIADRRVFFVDSRTGRRSPANRIANRYGISTSDRDIFLDHEIDEDVISAQFDKLIAQSLRDGHAVAIGHPHPATINVLKRKLPTLAQHGIAVVPMSTTIALQSGNTLFASREANILPVSTTRRAATLRFPTNDPLLREIGDSERYVATQ